MIFIFLILAIIALVYVYLTWNFDYWSKRGVPAPKAKVLFGDLPNGLTRKKHVVYDIQTIYDDFKAKTPFVGIIQTRDPRLLILEPEVVKDVLIRKFNNFRNSEFTDLIDVEQDPLFAQNPFFLKDEEWKEKRAEITPAFTTNRLKALYPLIQDVSARMIKYITAESKKSDPFDARELSAKFTTDVVSNCIFGVDAESFTKEKPEIREMGRRLLAPSTTVFFKIFLVESFTILKKFIKIQFMANEVKEFFVNLMQQALKYRDEKKIQREDFLDYVIQLRNKKHISELEMASHTISFFSDGFETSSIAISHALYELAKNKRVQNKLREEVNKHCDKDGQLNFETLNDIAYLDQVFHEALRLHPPAAMTSKMCSETTDLEHDGKKVTVDKGMNVYIPIMQIHYDSEYFLEPKSFHPERFDDGAMKDYLDRCVFLPFGAGPRICLGMRFALLQSKAAIAAIVRNFEFSVNEKTQDNPLIIDPKEFLNIKVGGLWLNFKPLMYKSKTPFVGFIQTRVPRLLILEPEVIKDVMIRKFNCFRQSELVEIVDTKLDPLFAMNPFLLKDEEWKETRADITPAFSTNRLKTLYPLVQDVSSKMIKYITTESKYSDPFEARELSAKFTTDVVSNCIYGIDAESFTKEKPEIREMGKRILEPNLPNVIKFFLAESFPFVRKLMRIQLMPDDVKEFFVNLMQQALKHRKENNIIREDFLDHIINLRNKKHISELVMASHTISFFSDGFETTSIALSHALYELGKNKRAQDKLRNEIIRYCNANGLLSYEKITELSYLDQVFFETLRLHPPSTMLSKQCTETADLEFDGKKVTVEKGINVFIPLMHIHYDSDYYLEPHTFYPERFDDGALKTYLDRCLLMPFGAGPRICLGMRFATMQTKAAIAAIVHNFEITVNTKTQDNPLIIDPLEFMNVKVGGLWLDFKSLQK